jgi:hypothetical protein
MRRQVAIIITPAIIRTPTPSSLSAFAAVAATATHRDSIIRLLIYSSLPPLPPLALCARVPKYYARRLRRVAQFYSLAASARNVTLFSEDPPL